MNNNYQMTTVVKYLELLDKEDSSDEKVIKASVEKYLHRNKAKKNASVLSELLA